jgi:patatin-like phospholipase/acyl hydrolase
VKERHDSVRTGSERGPRPFRVLSLDGGGMRGVYASTYLVELAAAFARKRGVAALDIGKGFDLIAGTSTGAIVACALAARVPLRDIVSLVTVQASDWWPVENMVGLRG